MDERRVELQRRHGDEGLAVVVGRLHALQLGLIGDARADADAGRQEGHAHRRGAQAPVDHALVEFEHRELAGLPSGAEVRLQREMVHRDEAEDELLQLLRRRQQADLGAAISDDGQILKAGAGDGTDQRHRLAPSRPSANADGHAVRQAGDRLVERDRLVDHVGASPEAVPAFAGVDPDYLLYDRNVKHGCLAAAAL